MVTLVFTSFLFLLWNFSSPSQVVLNLMGLMRIECRCLRLRMPSELLDSIQGLALINRASHILLLSSNVRSPAVPPHSPSRALCSSLGPDLPSQVQLCILSFPTNLHSNVPGAWLCFCGCKSSVSGKLQDLSFTRETWGSRGRVGGPALGEVWPFAKLRTTQSSLS